MGFWSHRQYSDYVEIHAGMNRHELLHPPGESFSDRYANISVRYDSMPDWMGFSNLITLDTDGASFKAKNEAHFRLLLNAYRFDRERYILEVKSRLSQIETRRTGLALLTEIASTDEDVTILPNRKSEVNSHTIARDAVDATARGKLTNYDNRDISIRGNRGSGKGTHATIQFTPGMYTGSVMSQAAKAPDEVLFHELVHASRQMRGVVEAIPVNAGYENQEEYLAILLTNIYLSEKGQWRFRATRERGPDDRIQILQGGDAEWFLRNVQHANLSPRKLIENFKRAQPVFYNALAHLPPDWPKFNPIRQYFEEQKGNFIM